MGGSSVRVRWFSPATTEMCLRQFFEGYGRITNIYFTSPIQAIVEFEDSRDAENAAKERHGKRILRRRVTVDKLVLRRTKFRLIVKNLSSRVSWQYLKDYMRKAGEVTYGNAHRPYPNEGVVEFASFDDMISAIEIFDDTELNGERIRLVEDTSGNRNRSIYRSRCRFRSVTGSHKSDSLRSHGGPPRSASISQSASGSSSCSSIDYRSRSHSGASSRSQDGSRSDCASTASVKSSTRSDESRSSSMSPKSRASTISQQVLDSPNIDETKHECPSCFSFMNPPICPCTESHCFCSDCPHYISKCEVCRGVMPKSRIISLQRDQSIKTHLCRYSEQGCDYIGSGMDLASHHIICKTTTMECPLKFINCTWLGKLPKMPQHCTEIHSHNFHIVSKKKFLISNFSVMMDRRIDMIFNVYGTFFRCAWDLNEETGDVRIAVYHVGNPLIYNQFSFEVVIHSEDSSALCLGGRIFQMYNYNERFIYEKYVGIKHKIMKEFCQRDGSLHFTVSILEE